MQKWQRKWAKIATSHLSGRISGMLVLRLMVLAAFLGFISEVAMAQHAQREENAYNNTVRT